MKKRITLLMWIAVLLASIAIQVLFVARVHLHPKNLRIHCENRLSSAAQLVPQNLRDQAEANHAEVLRLNQRFIRGFGEAVNVASVIMLIAIIGIVLEVKRMKIQQNSGAYRRQAAESSE